MATSKQFTVFDNRIDDLVERMEIAKILLLDDPNCVDFGKLLGLVDSASALQVNVRVEIRRTAATLADHQLDALLVGYSKLLSSKIELLNAVEAETNSPR